MSHVNFYILAGKQPDDRHQFSCCLIETAWRKGHRVHIHADSQVEAILLDKLLWQFREDSFIPHRLQNDDYLTKAPVTIDWQIASLALHDDVLINLAQTIPEQCTRFSRISEVVIQTPEVLAMTRTHYRRYEELGCPLSTHDMKSWRTTGPYC
ncbi:MAG: DNA polymerase III subunit chi [Endozoicomonadaceae bacterium]|nr:DNA polymerase III subunit chi [Endozoicomonadaceae bacterium]